MIDLHGGRDVLAATNLVFAAGLVLLSKAKGPAGLIAAWLVLGIGMGFGYEKAVATVAGLYGQSARNAITLFRGFASMVGWPLMLQCVKQHPSGTPCPNTCKSLTGLR